VAPMIRPAEATMRRKATEVTCLFVDVGGVLLTNGWDHQARKRVAAQFDISQTPARQVGEPEATLTFEDATAGRQGSFGLVAPEHRSAAALLIGWLEEQEGFASVAALGHRVVHGMGVRFVFGGHVEKP
jgi:hypothetical protein